jgi:hypothetical protein
MYTRKAVMTAALPATPCTPEMLQDVREVAQNDGVSVSEIVRQSLSLFLSKRDTLTNKNVDDTSVDWQPHSPCSDYAGGKVE